MSSSNRNSVKRLLAALLVSLLALPLGAAAHDHRRPRATLRVGGDVQEGHPVHADGWSKPVPGEPDLCEVTFASGFTNFKKPLRHSPGQEIVVRLHKAAAPVEVEAVRWLRLDENGYGRDPVPVPWTLRPHLINGKVRAWEVVIQPPLVTGHLYLGVAGYWRDEHDCTPEPDLGSQYAQWSFHLKGT